MALHSESSFSPRLIRAVLGLIAISIAGYILIPPLYWHFMEGMAAVTHSSSSCPSCFCDCSDQPTVSFPEGLGNLSFIDCVKRDPGMNKDTERTFAELLSEELKLREAEAMESHRRADIILLEAKKMTSQYQKEADKCNSGMETCEEARERTEAALAEQKRLTASWERRARQRGWRDVVVQSRAQAQARGTVQTS